MELKFRENYDNGLYATTELFFSKKIRINKINLVKKDTKIWKKTEVKIISLFSSAQNFLVFL